MIDIFSGLYKKIILPVRTKLKSKELRKYPGRMALIKDFHKQIEGEERYQSGILLFSENKDVYYLKYVDQGKKERVKEEFYVHDLEELIVEKQSTMMRRILQTAELQKKPKEFGKKLADLTKKLNL